MYLVCEGGEVRRRSDPSQDHELDGVLECGCKFKNGKLIKTLNQLLKFWICCIVVVLPRRIGHEDIKIVSRFPELVLEFVKRISH